MRPGLDMSVPVIAAIISATTDTIIAGYIGGRTPHVWTPEEWRRVYDAGLTPMPIYVAPGNQSGHEAGAEAGNSALAAMQALGIGGALVLDIEIEPLADSEWLRGFKDAVLDGDATPVLYANYQAAGFSLELGFAGLWLAAYKVATELRYFPDMVGWQYAVGPQANYSLWDSEAPQAFFG